MFYKKKKSVALVSHSFQCEIHIMFVMLVLKKISNLSIPYKKGSALELASKKKSRYHIIFNINQISMTQNFCCTVITAKVLTVLLLYTFLPCPTTNTTNTYNTVKLYTLCCSTQNIFLKYNQNINRIILHDVQHTLCVNFVCILLI